MEIKTITKQQATSLLPGSGEVVLIKGVKKTNWKSLPREIQQRIDIYIGNGSANIIVIKT